MSKERFGNKMSAGAALAASLLISNPAISEDSNEITNFSPTKISEFMTGPTSPEGDTNESVVLTVKHDGKYYSFTEMMDPRGPTIISGYSISELLMRAEKRLNIKLSLPRDSEIWLTHNHPAKVIIAYWSKDGVSADVYQNKAVLLNGPSDYDCYKFHEIVKEGYFSNSVEKYEYRNQVVEPGGTWQCSSDIKNDITKEDLMNYHNARKELLLATQNKKNSKQKIKIQIDKFIRTAKETMGIDLVFIPKK